jgi:hypothetical protein
MLRAAREMTGYILRAIDGEIGRCEDFLFDDERWAMRYMVADTSAESSGRKVLISPICLGKPDDESRLLHVYLSRQQIEEAPPIGANPPVSMIGEAWRRTHPHGSHYWDPSALWGPGVDPKAVVDSEVESTLSNAERPDPHLRSVTAFRGYSVKATDGEIGCISDLVLDADTWIVRYLEVDTNSREPRKNLLVRPYWVDHVSGEDRREIKLNVPRSQVEKNVVETSSS